MKSQKTILKAILFVGCAVMTSQCFAQNLDYLFELVSARTNEKERLERLDISGAKVSRFRSASKMAMDYFERTKLDYVFADVGIRDDAAAYVLGYDMEGFGKKGDIVWEFHINGLFGATLLDVGLRAVVWINANTEKLHLVCGCMRSDWAVCAEGQICERADSAAGPQSAKGIEGDEAARIALKEYARRMPDASADAVAVPSREPVMMGFSICGFARPDDKVWEVRIASSADQRSSAVPEPLTDRDFGIRPLRALLLVHSQTGQAYSLAAPWISASDEEVKAATESEGTVRGALTEDDFRMFFKEACAYDKTNVRFRIRSEGELYACTVGGEEVCFKTLCDCLRRVRRVRADSEIETDSIILPEGSSLVMRGHHCRLTIEPADAKPDEPRGFKAKLTVDNRNRVEWVLVKEGLLLFAQPGGNKEPGQGGGAVKPKKSIFRGLRLQAAPQTEAQSDQ